MFGRELLDDVRVGPPAVFASDPIDDPRILNAFLCAVVNHRQRHVGETASWYIEVQTTQEAALVLVNKPPDSELAAIRTALGTQPPPPLKYETTADGDHLIYGALTSFDSGKCLSLSRAQWWSRAQRHTRSVKIMPNGAVTGQAPMVFTASDPELLALADADAAGVLTADFLYSAADRQHVTDAGLCDACWFGPRDDAMRPAPLSASALPTDLAWDQMRRRLGSSVDLVWVKAPETGVDGEFGLMQRAEWPGKDDSVSVAPTGNTASVTRNGKITVFTVRPDAKSFEAVEDTDMPLGMGTVPTIGLAVSVTNYAFARRKDGQWQLMHENDDETVQGLSRDGDAMDIGGGRHGHFVLLAVDVPGHYGDRIAVLEFDADAKVVNLWHLVRRPGARSPPSLAATTGWDRVGIRAFHSMQRRAGATDNKVVVLLLDPDVDDGSGRRLADAMNQYWYRYLFVPAENLPDALQPRNCPKHQPLAMLGTYIPHVTGRLVVATWTFPQFRDAVRTVASNGFEFDAAPQSLDARQLPPLPDQRMPVALMQITLKTGGQIVRQLPVVC